MKKIFPIMGLCLIMMSGSAETGRAENYEPKMGTSFECRVVKVVDGDSWHCSNGIKVRAWGYDAPEKDQPYGSDSTRVVDNLIQGGTLVCSRRGKSFDRVVARCSLSGSDIGTWMVRHGHAWSYRGLYDHEEYLARIEQRGLWARPAVNPREWRQR